MPYAKSLVNQDGDLVVQKVLNKMSELRQRHMATGTTNKLATSIAFEYGRELIGFDNAEKWRLSA